MKIIYEKLWLILPLMLMMACGGGGNGNSGATNDNSSYTIPVITSQPSSLSVGNGATAVFTVAVSGNPSPGITWERSIDSGSTWTTINSSTGFSYSFTVKLTDSGTQFKAIATNSAGSTTSNVVILTVTALPSVYAAGYSCSDLTSTAKVVTWACYWKDGTFIYLKGLDATESSSVNSITVSGSDVYVGGWCTDSSSTVLPGYWKNATWVGLTPVDGSTSSEVCSVAISENDIYAAGYCACNAWAYPGYWKNGTWVDLPLASGSSKGVVNAILVSGSDVFAAGRSGTVPGIWKNGVWVGLSLPSDTTSGEVTSLVASGSDIYAAGWSRGDTQGTVPGYWLNGTWVALTPYEDVTNSEVRSIAVSGTDVFAAGGNLVTPGYWKNGNWVGFTQPYGGGGVANSIVTYGTDVYVGGCQIGSAGNIDPGYMLNKKWVDLETSNWVVKSIAVQ